LLSPPDSRECSAVLTRARRSPGVALLPRALFAAVVAIVLAGCSSERPPSSEPARPTYWREVAPLLETHCGSCHFEGGIAPMPLTSFEQARPFAWFIASEVAAGRMPPWPAASEGCRPLQDERRLSPAEIETLANWALDGAPEGDRADYVPPPPRPERMSELPAQADLVVMPVESYTPDFENGDDYRCFVIDPGLETARDVVGVRFTPGDARVVHHLSLSEIREESLEELEELDEADPGPGYRCPSGTMVVARSHEVPPESTDRFAWNVQFLANWGPGGSGHRFPEGATMRLAPRSRLVLQVHYSAASGVQGAVSDRSRVELFFAPQPPETQVWWASLASFDFRVPPGARPEDPASVATASLPVVRGMRILGATPHMHLRGRSLRIDVRRTNGERECLLSIPEWRFHWQQSYWFATPFLAPEELEGETLEITCRFDNTAANQPIVGGVRREPQELKWGIQTNDEMCESLLLMPL
jgi:hypothetical protein